MFQFSASVPRMSEPELTTKITFYFTVFACKAVLLKHSIMDVCIVRTAFVNFPLNFDKQRYLTIVIRVSNCV
jgi:hypothetical protein